MTTIHVRTDEKIKRDVQRILMSLGLDLSTAVNMFLVQVKLQKGIPFPVVTENGFTPAQEEKILKELAWARKNGKRFTSTKEMFRDILGK
ncbi:type II toxin-antitoxin system RelB/DinJ family antitoxin [Candidatus Peregrinibacteria bacterium]|nr:type II toxin-antitoxin system RelB/DinJ family antitoxin [Candidatus Peregrinibacteria bacterium]